MVLTKLLGGVAAAIKTPGYNSQANGYGGYAAPAQTNGHSNHYGAVPSSTQNFALSTQAYRAEHGLIVEGDNVPDPLQSFDSAGFSAPIMDEVYQSITAKHACVVMKLPPSAATPLSADCRPYGGSLQ